MGAAGAAQIHAVPHARVPSKNQRRAEELVGLWNGVVIPSKLFVSTWSNIISAGLHKAKEERGE